MEDKKKFCNEFEQKHKGEISIKFIKENNENLIWLTFTEDHLSKIFKNEYEKYFNIPLVEQNRKVSKKTKLKHVFFKEDNGDTMPAKIKEPRPNKMAKEEICCKEAPKTTKSSKNPNNKNNKK